jgi:putative ABC transport system permease protein
MIKNYFKITLRVLWKNRVYVIINLLGLGFALACCILSYLNYDYRASFDKNHRHTENIYRLNSVRNIEESYQRWGITPMVIGDYLAKDITGAGRIARLYSNNVVVKKKENVFGEKVYYADKNIFSFFDLPLAEGNYTQFDKPNTIIVSQPLAEKYFGKEEIIGRQLAIIRNGQEEIFTVIGVLKNIPSNSSFQFDIVTTFTNGFAPGDLSAGDLRSKQMTTTFAEINNKAMVGVIEKKLTAYTTLYNINSNDWKIKNFYFQPFNEVALSSDIDFEAFVHGGDLNSNPRGVMVIVPVILSVFILLIACFNFTNISIAFASKRLKEIGVRKAMGVRKWQLIIQFLGENILQCLVASALALLLVYALLPFFYTWTGVELPLHLKQNYTLWMILLVLPIFTAIVAGLYPSVYISSFEPVGILKGINTFGPKSRFTRILLSAQFSICCLALVVGITLVKNTTFQKEVDFGYSINEVMVTEISNRHEFVALSDAISKDPRIESIAGTVQQIGAGTRETKLRYNTNNVTAQVAEVGGLAYLNTMGIKLIDGRQFLAGEGLDKEQAVIVNETLIKKINLHDPVGKQIEMDSSKFTIVGVVKDYKEFGLHGKVPACVLKLAAIDDYKYFVVRANQRNMAEVEKLIKEAWYKVSPGKPYNGFLQSTVIDKERYMNAGFKSVSFSLAAIILLLSASGLFALVSLNILRRQQEIGVRKVLGASILNIIGMISKDFIYILLIAFIIGSALAYLIIDKIIFNFIYAYNPAIAPEAFITTLLIVLLFCAMTVGLKVYRAANANPVKSLKAE